MQQLSTYVKQGDTQPALKAQVNMALGGASVQFVMTTPDGTIIVNQPAGILDFDQGIVQYQWQPGDTATPSPDGVGHKAEFQITFQDGSRESFPNTGYIAVYILPTLSP